MIWWTGVRFPSAPYIYTKEKVKSKMDNNFKQFFSDTCSNLEAILNTKTVVGEEIKTKDATIIPLIEVSCGMGIGEFANKDNKLAGGLSTKATPVAVIVIQNGYTKVINIKNQDAITKLIDLFPDVVNKIFGKNELSKEVKDKIDDIDVEYYNENI